MTSDVELNVNTILAILAERAGARPCLDAAGIAALALDHPTVTGLHIRVDPRRDILATEEMLLPEQERAMEIEAMAEGRALRNVFSAWTAGLDRHVHTSWSISPTASTTRSRRSASRLPSTWWRISRRRAGAMRGPRSTPACSKRIGPCLSFPMATRRALYGAP